MSCAIVNAVFDVKLLCVMRVVFIVSQCLPPGGLAINEHVASIMQQAFSQFLTIRFGFYDDDSVAINTVLHWYFFQFADV